MSTRTLKLIDIASSDLKSQKKADFHNLLHTQILMFWVEEPNVKVSEPYIAAYSIKIEVNAIKLGRVFWNSTLYSELDKAAIDRIVQVSSEDVDPGEFAEYFCVPFPNEPQGTFLTKT